MGRRFGSLAVALAAALSLAACGTPPPRSIVRAPASRPAPAAAGTRWRVTPGCWSAFSEQAAAVLDALREFVPAVRLPAAESVAAGLERATPLPLSRL